MAGRESSGNPSGEQGATCAARRPRRRSVGGVKSGKRRPRFKKRTWGAGGNSSQPRANPKNGRAAHPLKTAKGRPPSSLTQEFSGGLDRLRHPPGRESSGNPSGEQAGRRNGPQDKPHSKKSRAKARPLQRQKRRDKAKADPSPPFPQKTRDWVRDDTPKERRELERAVRKKNEKRRNRYRAVHGKVVDWVDHWIEEGWLFVSIRFKDQTDLRLQFGAKMVTDEIDLWDVKSGSLRLVRRYFRRRSL
jgi:hypothetical protein